MSNEHQEPCPALVEGALTAASVRAVLQRMICGVCGDLFDDSRVDGEGDLAFRTANCHGWAMVRQGARPDIIICAVLADGVRATRPVLSEINDLNRSSGVAKVFLNGRGAVMMQRTLDWQSLSVPALRDAVRELVGHAEYVAPLLSMVHCGSAARQGASVA